MEKKFSGTYTALATPFLNGKVDEASLEKLVRSQVSAGINGFIVNGTTGESPTLRVEEVQQILEKVRSLKTKSQQVILGVGTNSTHSTLEWVKRANDWGVDGVLAVVPYYNKPPQRGLVKHFEAIANESQSPVILYNVPGRTIQSLSAESIGVLAQHKMIAGIKESTGDLQFLNEVLAEVPEDFSVLSGDDGTAVEFCLRGGDGLIGVITHVIPQQIKELVAKGLKKDDSAREEYKQWSDLVDSIYLEANPIPVKKALQFMGIFESAELRSPLVELSEPLAKRLKECLQQHQIL